MRKSCRETALFKAIAGVAAAGMIGLSVSTSALAFEYEGSASGSKVFGLSLTGDFSFSNVSVMGFASQPVSNMGDMESTFFSVSDGTATTHLPLLTFGEDL